MSDPDDDALTWAGARDPSHYETPEAKAPKLPRGAKAVPATADAATASDHADDEADERPSMSAVVLVCLGVLGGIYGLYTIGWFVSWRRLVYTDTVSLRLFAFSVQQVLAILAPALWFGTTIYFTRNRKPTLRLLWLVIGALLLVPWSFTFGQ